MLTLRFTILARSGVARSNEHFRIFFVTGFEVTLRRGKAEKEGL